MANITFDKHNSEYFVTLNDGREERVSWEVWYAIRDYQKRKDNREEARFRTEDFAIELSDEDLDEIADIYERNYERDRSEYSQWEDAIESFMTNKRIEDYFGNHWRDIRIDDDSQPYGGTAHADETLGEFVDSVDLNGNDSLRSLDAALFECGVEIRR